MINKDNWTHNQGHNYIMKPEDKSFMISYLPPGWMPLIDIFGSDTDKGETALVRDEKYYILNGDWTDAYEPLVSQGFEVCFKFFEENKEKNKSSWSN